MKTNATVTKYFSLYVCGSPLLRGLSVFWLGDFPKRTWKGKVPIGLLLSSVLRYHAQGIAYRNDTGYLNFGGHSTLPFPPIPQHTPTFSTTDVTRIPTSGRDSRKSEGRGGGEKRVNQNTNCFVQLHKTWNPIPRQWSGMRLYTQDCMPLTTSHCGMCAGSCLVTVELVASHSVGVIQLLVSWGFGWVHTPLLGERRTGGLIHTPGEGERKGGRDGGREGQREGGMEGGRIRVYWLQEHVLFCTWNLIISGHWTILFWWDLTKMNQEVCIRNASSVDG